MFGKGKSRVGQPADGCFDAAFSKLKADVRHLIMLQTLLIVELIFVELYLPF